MVPGYSSSQEAHEACDEHLSIFHRDPEVVRRRSNRFALVLAKLPDAVTQTCLQAVCNGLRGTRAIEDSVQCGNMEPHLVRLVELGLVTDDLVGGWKPTWLGVGVARTSWLTAMNFENTSPDREVAGAVSIKLTIPVRWSNRRRNFCGRTPTLD